MICCKKKLFVTRNLKFCKKKKARTEIENIIFKGPKIKEFFYKE